MTAIALIKLQKAGFSQYQVEALAEYLDTQAATKADIAALELKLAETKAELIKWVVGVAFGQTALLMAMAKMFGAGHF